MRRVLMSLLALAVGLPVYAGPDLAKLLDQADLQYEETDRGGLRLLYDFDDGRTHLVFLQPQGDIEDLEVVEIYAPVMRLENGTVPAALATRLLEASGQRKLTYFGVEDVEGTLMVFAYHNMPTAGLTSRTLSTLLRMVAAFADEMEKEQLGAASDEF